MFYLRWPDLCKPCGCAGDKGNCRTYRPLWQQFLVDRSVTVAQALSQDLMAHLLLGWRDLAEGQGAIEHEQLCYGPDARVNMFDLATFAAVRQQARAACQGKEQHFGL